MTKVQTWTMTGLGLLSLVIGVILAGMAVTSAQESSPTATATPAATEPTDDDGSSDTTDDSTTDDATDIGDCPGGLHGLGGWRSVEAAAGEILGLSHDELRDAFDEGQTLADIAEAQGMSADDLEAAIVENVTADLQVELDAGDITQDQFDEATADLSNRVDELVNSAAPQRGGPHGPGVWHLVEDAVATILGLTEDDLHSAFDDGQTLADIAEAQGVGVDDFKASIIANVTAELQAQLDAGDITQEQFDALTSELNDRIDDIVNNAGPMGGRGGRGFGHGGPGGFGPGSFFGDDTSTDDSAETTTDA